MRQSLKNLFVALFVALTSIGYAQDKTVDVVNLSSCIYEASSDELKKKVTNHFVYNDFSKVLTEDWDVLKFEKIQNAVFQYNGIDKVKKSPEEKYKSYLLKYTVTITFKGAIMDGTASFEMVVVSEPMGYKIPQDYKLREGEGLNYDAFFSYLNNNFEAECP
jgi:hypothetical protein